MKGIDSQSPGFPHFQSANETSFRESSFRHQRSDRCPERLGSFKSCSIPSANTPQKDQYSDPSTYRPSPKGSSAGSTTRQWLVRSPRKYILSILKSSPHRSLLKILSSRIAKSTSRQKKKPVRGTALLSLPFIDPSPCLSAGLSSGRLYASYRRGSVGSSPLHLQKQQSQW